MPNGDPWDGFFYPTLTLMIDSYITLCLLMVTCGLLITYANNLEPDQDHLDIRPDLDPNHLTL